MPMKSKKQNALMHAAAKSPKVAKKTGVSQSVAKKFVAESHGQNIKKLPKRKTKK